MQWLLEIFKIKFPDELFTKNLPTLKQDLFKSFKYWKIGKGGLACK